MILLLHFGLDFLLLFLIIVSSLRCFFGAAAKTMLLTPIATMDGRAILVYSVSSHELPSLKRKEISLLTGQYEPAGKKTCLTEYVGRPPCVNGQCRS